MNDDGDTNLYIKERESLGIQSESHIGHYVLDRINRQTDKLPHLIAKQQNNC